MIVSPENIFPGAKIRLGVEQLTVIKVNAKSFYATKMTYSEYNELYGRKLSSTTFVQFCKANNIKSYKYTDDFHIEDEEVSRKDVAIENSSKQAYKLDKAEKMAIAALVKDYEKKKKIIRLVQFQVGKSLIRFLEVRGHNFLLNIEGDYVLYSMDTDEAAKICTVYDYNYPQIPWGKLSCFAGEYNGVNTEEKIVLTA